MQTLNFAILLVIIVPQNFVTLHLIKIHLPLVSLNVHGFELNRCSKEQSKKKTRVSRGSENVDIWKSDWETRRDKLLPGVFRYYRKNWQVWLTNTGDLSTWQRVKVWFLVLEIFRRLNVWKTKRTNEIIMQIRKKMPPTIVSLFNRLRANT